MNVINLQSSTGELCSIIIQWPLCKIAKSKQIFGNIFLFQITTLITLFFKTDQSFLFSDSNFEASCVHVDLSKTATRIIIFTNGLYTFATLFIEKLFKQKRNTQNVKGSVYILPLTLTQRLFNESQSFVCK